MAAERMEEVMERLELLRGGPFGEPRRKAKERLNSLTVLAMGSAGRKASIHGRTGRR
jgi:hypothetical protein